jgi:hypothetical protein
MKTGSIFISIVLFIFITSCSPTKKENPSKKQAQEKVNIEVHDSSKKSSIENSDESESQIIQYKGFPKFISPSDSIVIDTSKFFFTALDDSLVIFGPCSLNKRGYLLNFQNKEIKQVLTTRHLTYQTEIFSKAVTRTNCSKEKEFDLFISGDTTGFSWIEPSKANENVYDSILENFDLTLYDDSFSENGWALSAFEKQIEATPRIEEITFDEYKFYLLTYNIETYPNNTVPGPQFLLMPKKLGPWLGHVPTMGLKYFA